MDMDHEKKLTEAALFMAGNAMSVNDISKTINQPFAVAMKLLEDVMKEFNSKDSALEIIKTGNMYQMKVKPEYAEQVSHLAADKEFSKAVLRCLGLISVKQPVKQSLIVQIIGNKAYDYVKELTEKGFLKAARQGTTKLLTTTKKFEEYFGKPAGEVSKIAGQEYQATL